LYTALSAVAACYPHLPIGKVWLYRLLFVCVFYVCVFVCTVTDFSAKDKASGVKFCTEVHRHQRQGISHLGELCSPRSPESDESASARATSTTFTTIALWLPNTWMCRSWNRAACGRRIDMCGCTSVPEDGRTCCPIMCRSLYCDVSDK